VAETMTKAGTAMWVNDRVVPSARNGTLMTLAYQSQDKDFADCHNEKKLKSALIRFIIVASACYF
jgi:hypothetical protein